MKKRRNTILRRNGIAVLVLSALLLVVVLAAVACTNADGATTSTIAAGSEDSITPSTGSPAATDSTTATEPADETGQTATTDSTATADTDAAETDSDDAAYTATDTSYESADTSIVISTVTVGSGRDTVTYYVADVQLSGGATLASAFSGGGYGGDTQDTSDIASETGAILAINGDYYSSRNNGIIIREGVLYRDVPTRTGLALYQDGTMEVYDETETSGEELLAAGVWSTFSFGPALLEDAEIVDGIDSYEADANAKHPIQGTNPRTGIGMISPGHYVFVVVDGRSLGYSRGVTLTEFAQIFQGLGCQTAYNLDGGGSATLYFMGEVVNQPSQKRGERSVSDILYVGA